MTRPRSADLRWEIGHEHKGFDGPRRLARWSAGVLMAGWAFADIDATGSRGGDIFASLDDNVRDTLAVLAVLPIAIPVAGLAVALFMSNGSFFRSARDVLAGPERAYTIDVSRGIYLRRRTRELGVAWRRWLIGGWWLLAAAAGLATTAVTGVLLRGVGTAWLAWFLALVSAGLIARVEAALTTGRYPERPVVPTPEEIDGALMYWAVSSTLRLRPSLPPYGLALMQAYTGRSSVEIAETVYESGSGGGPVVWMQRWLVVGVAVIVYSLLPAPSVTRFADDGWWGRAFVNLHGVAGVAQDHLGISLVLGVAAFALVPLALVGIYTRFMLAHRVPRPVVRQVLAEFRPDFFRSPLYLLPSVAMGAGGLALLLWLAAAVADATDSAVLGFVALVVPGLLVATATKRGMRWLYTRGPYARNIRPHPLDPVVGAPGKALPDRPRRFVPRIIAEGVGEVRCLAVDPDVGWVATGNDDGVVAFWDPASGARLAAATGHVGPVTALAVAAAPGWLASGGADGTLRLWDAPVGTIRATFTRTAADTVNAVALAPDGSWLASAGTEGGTVILDTATGVTEPERYGLAYEPRWLATLSAARLAGGSPVETVVWDIADRSRSQWYVDAGSDRVYLGAGAVEPLGRWVARAREDGTVRIFDANNGDVLVTLRGAGTEPACLAVAPDGDWLAAGFPDGTVRLWEVRRGRILAEFTAHPRAVAAVAATADGTALVSAGTDGTVRLWNLDAASDNHCPL